MKRIALIISLVLIVSLFSACGTQNNSSENSQASNETVQEQDVKIEITKDTLSDAEEFLKNMKKYGAEVEDDTDNNAYILVFSKDDHQKLLDDKYAEIIKAFKEYEDDENHYIDAVEYDEDFRNLVFNVNKDIYDASTDETNNILIAAKVLSYQMYLGKGQKTNVEVVYSGTEEVISSFTLPMNLIG